MVFLLRSRNGVKSSRDKILSLHNKWFSFLLNEISERWEWEKSSVHVLPSTQQQSSLLGSENVHKDEVSSGFAEGRRERERSLFHVATNSRWWKKHFSPTTTSFPQYSTIFLHTYCFTIYMCGAHKWIYFLVGGRACGAASACLGVCGCDVTSLCIYNKFITSTHLKNPSVFIDTHNG